MLNIFLLVVRMFGFKNLPDGEVNARQPCPPEVQPASENQVQRSLMPADR